MRKATKFARKAGALIIGIPLVILGIILIPLPGPGLLVSFAGLFVLAQEFDWAQKYADQLKDRLQGVIDKAKKKAHQPEETPKPPSKKPPQRPQP